MGLPVNVRWRLGTMGYSYPGWAKTFYPPRTPRNEWLSAYARQFNCVELNTTFHATPAPDRLAAWAEAVPTDFRFAVKVGRHITHDAAPNQMPARLGEFCWSMEALGSRLSCLLLQFPPTFHYDRRGDLARMLEVVPPHLHCVVEFRSATWLRPETWQLLSAKRAGCVAIDHSDHPELAQIQVTGPIAYLRLVGKHGRYESDDRELFDPTPQLQVWWGRLQQASLEGVEEIWVLFNNDYAGHAPATLRRFAAIAGIPLPPPPPAAPTQKRLFD